MFMELLSNNIIQHKSVSFNEAVILSYKELINSSQLELSVDFKFNAFSRESIAAGTISEISAEQLNDYFVLPVFTGKGLRRIRESDTYLNTVYHNFIYDNVVTLHENAFSTTTATDKQVTGAIFSGSYAGEPIKGYVTVDEIKAVLVGNSSSDLPAIKSLLLEAALYRAIQRLDQTLLSKPLVFLKYVHELRNFNYFSDTSIDSDIFKEINSIIGSRSDYLKSVSTLWRDSFNAEMHFLSYSLTDIAIKHNLDMAEIKLQAYKLCADSAQLNRSINPVAGEIYILVTSNNEKQGKVHLSVQETVKGRLDRCFAKAGLKSVQADIVYSDDEFSFEAKGESIHNVPNYNTASRGYRIGSYACLKFVDGTYMSTFIDETNLLEIAEYSGIDTWNGIFADRMCIKHAISVGLAECDWNHKSIIHQSAYLS